MKIYKFLLSMVVAGGMVFINLAAMAEGDTKDGVVTVVGVQGTGLYSIDGGHAWSPLVVGKELPAGSIVRSGDMSVVDLLIGKAFSDKVAENYQYKQPKAPALNLIPQGEKNMVRMRPNTTLGIDKLTVPSSDPTVVSDCQLDLKKGRILASIKKVNPSSEYLIKIPNGVAAVRGTQITIDTDGTPGGTTCGVVSGTVWLSFSITGPDGTPIDGSNGQPLAPIEISLTPGQSFGLTGALLNSLINTAKSAPPAITAAELATLLVTAADTQVNPISPSELNTLTTVLAALVTPTIQTINVTITTSDNGTPPYVSP